MCILISFPLLFLIFLFLIPIVLRILSFIFAQNFFEKMRQILLVTNWYVRTHQKGPQILYRLVIKAKIHGQANGQLVIIKYAVQDL